MRVRGPPLPGHARQPRLCRPQPHPAVLRHRGRDARARAGADLSRHDAPGRHDRADAAAVHVRPAAADARHPDAAVQRSGAERRHRAGAACSGPTSGSSGCVEARATRALTGALSAEVGRVVEQTFGVDTFQITPLLTDPYQQSTRLNFNPTARVTIGKRISNRIFLTYARSLSARRSDRDHPARVRRERFAVVGAVAERGPHLRARSAKEARLLMPRSCACRGRARHHRCSGRRRSRVHRRARPRTSAAPSPTSASTSPASPRSTPTCSTWSRRASASRSTMAAVRATIDHLVGLGRFEDVRVFASPADQGVTLRWQLTPVRRIARITVTGNAVLPASGIRSELTDRYGALPSANRARRHGDDPQGVLRRSRLSARDDPAAARGRGTAPERVELVLPIEAGERVTIRAATVTGTSLDPARRGAADAGPAARAAPTIAPALEARIAAYEESLRERGYYEARVRESRRVSEDGRTVSLTVDGRRRAARAARLRRRSAARRRRRRPGADPRGALGRSGPARGRQPAHREPLARRRLPSGAGAVFAPAGGRRADAHLHGGARPAASRRSRWTSGATKALDRADIAPLLQIKPGDPFVESRVGLVSAAITELYRVRGYAQAAVKADVQVLPEAADASVRFRPVAIRFDDRRGPADHRGERRRRRRARKAIPAETLKSLLALTAGRPFYRPQLTADRDAIDRAYRNQGYQSVVGDLAAGVCRTTSARWRSRGRSAKASRSRSIAC